MARAASRNKQPGAARTGLAQVAAPESLVRGSRGRGLRHSTAGYPAGSQSVSSVYFRALNPDLARASESRAGKRPTTMGWRPLNDLSFCMASRGPPSGTQASRPYILIPLDP